MKRLFLFITTVTFLIVALSGAALADPPWLERSEGKFIPPGLMKKQMKFHFKDLERNHWAAEAIERMVLKGVIKGFDDFTFRGGEPVTKLQTIVMALRLLDPEDIENRETVDPVFTRFGWGKNYMTLAVENNIIAPEDLLNFKPHQPAKRYEAAVILARALGLEEEAQDAMDKVLYFKDWHQIPESCRGYVYVMVEEGYLQGYNGKIYPHKPITRSEMAALLARMDGDVDNELDRWEIRGTIEEIDKDGMTIEIDCGRYGDREIEVIENAAIYVNGKATSFGNLKAGMRVVVILNADGDAVFVSARETDDEEEEGFELRGLIKDIDRDKDDDDNDIYELRIKVGNREYDLTLEEDGNDYQLTIEDKGTYELDENYVDIDALFDAEDNDNIYLVIKIEGEEVVKFALENEEEDFELRGEIEKINGSNGYYFLTLDTDDGDYDLVLKADGNNYELKIENKGSYILDGNDVDIDELFDAEDDQSISLVIKVDDGDIEEFTLEYEESEYYGVIEEVYKKNGVYKIEVEIDDEDYTWEIDEDTELTMDGEQIYPEELMEDCEFEAVVANDIIISLEVERITLRGEIYIFNGNVCYIRTERGDRGSFEIDENDADAFSNGDEVEVIIEKGLIIDIEEIDDDNDD